MSQSHPAQNYKNHRRFPPIFFAIAILVLLANAVWCLVSLISRPDMDHGRSWVVAMALVVIALYARRSAQVVQDRVIRDEMRLRLKEVLPSERHGEITALTLSQLVGLRFASDAELPALCADISAGRLGGNQEIKQRIVNWQADWLRV